MLAEMPGLPDVALILVGLAFLWFGAAFSSYGVSGLGLTVGAGVGYLLGPEVAALASLAPMAGTAVAVIAGAIVGVILGYVLLSMAVGALGFVIGTYVGLSVVAGMLVEGGGVLEYVVAIACGLVIAVLGTVLTRTMMVLLTSFIGAALASAAIDPNALSTAQANLTPDPLLFDVTAPLFVGLFVLGLLVQFGLFKLGYVTKLLSLLPGVRPLRNRTDQN